MLIHLLSSSTLLSGLVLFLLLLWLVGSAVMTVRVGKHEPRRIGETQPLAALHAYQSGEDDALAQFSHPELLPPGGSEPLPFIQSAGQPTQADAGSEWASLAASADAR